MATEQNQPIIQLYSDGEMKTAISPLLDYKQIIPPRNKKYASEDNKHLIAYGVGKYIVDSSTLRTLDYNNIDAFKTQLETSNFYPLSVLCDTDGFMYSVIPDGTFATENYVRTYVNNLIVDGSVNLSDYATIKYVDDEIAKIIREPGSDENIETLTIFAYCAATSIPDIPNGGSWVKESDGTITINYPEGWGSLSDVSTYPIYMSSSLQLENGKFISDWSTPIIISGANGEPGKDGETIEFKYVLTETNDVPILPGEQNSPNWTDEPSGINIDMQYEWMIMRRVGDIVGNWSTPALWSRWAVDGKDGSEIEYIYIRNNGNSVSNPTPSYPKYDEAGNILCDDIKNDITYQTNGYCPVTWTQNPQGVDKDAFTHEWVCIRKKTNGYWHAFSDPAIWAIVGQPGTDGYSIRTLYKAFNHDISGEEISGEVDIFRTDENVSVALNSGWSAVAPINYNSDQWLWNITAYITSDNKLAQVIDSDGKKVYGWQGPMLISGKGKDATPLNYNTYVYTNSGESSVAPNKPTITNMSNVSYPIDNIWLDYPSVDSVDNETWWQCIGLVNGVTNDVSWGNVIPLNGKDGAAKDGKHYEFRMQVATVTDNRYEIPEWNNTDREPNGWALANLFVPGTLNSDQCILQISALIDSDDKLVGTWSSPFRITGENGHDGVDGEPGPTGEPGPNGLSGTPGTDFIVKYCRGKIEDINGDGIEDNVLYVVDENNYDSSGWYDNVDILFTDVNTEYPYIYCVQGRKKYTRIDNTNTFNENIEWGTPFRLSGTNGLPGDPGKSGQIIYPAGIYDTNKEYSLDDMKAPYVFDSQDGCYYVLNCKRWVGVEQDNKTPMQAGDEYWTKFEQFEAIYADIGMFRSALVGSAVFNGYYMFSQNGIDANGNLSNDYENFDKNDPYGDNATFKPAFCVNLKSGQTWLSNGNVMFNPDGSGELAGGQIYWNENGKLTLPMSIILTAKYDYDELSANTLSWTLNVENASDEIINDSIFTIKLLKENGAQFSTIDVTTEVKSNRFVSKSYNVVDKLYDELPNRIQLWINNVIAKDIEFERPDITSKRLIVSTDGSGIASDGGWGLSTALIKYKFSYDDITDKKIKRISDYAINVDDNNDVETDISFTLRPSAYAYDVNVSYTNCSGSSWSFNFDRSGGEDKITVRNIKPDARITFAPEVNVDSIISDAIISYEYFGSTVSDEIVIGPFNCVAQDASVATIVLHYADHSNTIEREYAINSSTNNKVTFKSKTQITKTLLNACTVTDGDGNKCIECDIKLSNGSNGVITPGTYNGTLIDERNILIPLK